MGFSALAIVGPTASGKSGLALSVVEALESSGQAAEIINADAMQLYRSMDIGTAKLPKNERRGIAHHLIDAIEPSAEMTAAEYSKLAIDTANEIRARNKLPVFVGGSMFYLAAALDHFDFAPTDKGIRNQLESQAEAVGTLEMHNQLAALDPESGRKIHSNNIRKVIRALEVIQITGQPFPSTLPEPEYLVPTLTIGINVEREVLKPRIANRVAEMWSHGLIDEAGQLLDGDASLSKTALAAIGYQQAFQQISGDLTEAAAIQETIQLTNRYARRQMSWFMRDRRTHWLPDSPKLLQSALERIRLGV
ncbi:tRNA (adenosine(37)-N6)-dimethylallyltransferase MiaA [Aquiluna sp. Uisw_065]|uniref:tRNA (adenosine(37)-N6)-dimethylallyltransferase MiaA n=1 Tax=Aquiluna sp. Uisw_065 TaxID=3230967 RepID=UPI0039EC48AD